MRKTELLCAFLSIPMLTEAAYSKRHKGFENANFFDSFDFFTETDPTHGTVEYVSRQTASQLGLIKPAGLFPNSSIYIGVDHNTTITSPTAGRRSVRLESKASFQHGLFILDLDHMPSGCGSWPAFWTLGNNWPHNGEIDIIENVNSDNFNKMALHTGQGCMISDPASSQTLYSAPWLEGKKLEFRGKVKDNLVNCQSPLPGTVNDNRGCSIHDEKSPAGESFNKQGGGVYAMEWTKDFIKIWMWKRGEIPANVLGNAPEPRGWGVPSGIFAGACDVEKFFVKHKLVFNISFCGDWAGDAGVWEQSKCGAKSAYGKVPQTCSEFVRSNPGVYKDTYWQIRSLKVWNS